MTGRRKHVTEATGRPKRDPLPKEFGSLEEAGEFWDTHDSTDYEEYMKEVRVEAGSEPSDTRAG
jgi:hypothetical protein